MRRLALALIILAPLPALSAQTPAERANAELQRGIQQDRVADAERDLAANGRTEAPAVVQDMDAERAPLTGERRDARSIGANTTSQAGLPLLSDNPQR